MSGLEGFSRVCELDDIWEGEMSLYQVDGQGVLLIRVSEIEICAYDPACPHQGHSLAAGELEDCILTCPSHLWEFDAETGEGINPGGVALTAYRVKIQDGVVFVALPAAKKAVNA